MQPGPVLGVPHESEKWARIHTRHFDLVGEVSPERLQRIGVRLERFRAVLHHGRTEAGSTEETRVILVFKSDASFRSYKIQEDGHPANFQGLFIWGQGRAYIAMNGDPDVDPYGIIYHEYVHDDLRQRYGSIPLWLNEGLAEYYTTFQMYENQAEIGRAVENHVLLLRDRPLLPLGEIFSIDANSPSYHEGERQGMFYAESWALVHYCLQGSGTADKMQTFLRESAGTVSTAAAFEHAFGVDFDAVETALTDYVRGTEFSYNRLTFADLDVDESAEPAALSRPDLLCLLGDYLVASAPKRTGFIQSHYRAALDLDPNHAGAHAGLGSSLATEGKWTEARDYFERAIELDRQDASVFLQYGLAQLQQAAGDSFLMRPTSLPAGIEAARALLSRSLEIDAQSGEALYGIGRSYLYDPGDVEPGLAAIQRARELLPAQPDVDYTLMVLLLRRDDRAQAQQVADRLLSYARDPQIVERVKHVFESQQAASEADRHNAEAARYNEILERLNRGDLALGIAELDSLLATGRDAEIRGLAQQARSDATLRLEEREALRLHNRHVERYNKAVKLANAGNLQGAIDALDALAREVKDPRMSASIRDLRRSVAGELSARRRR